MVINMVGLQSKFLIFAAIVVISTESSKLCELTDSACLIRVAKREYKTLLHGIDGFIKPIDPLFQDKIVGELPNIKYELRQAILTGMKNCEVTMLKLNINDVTFFYVLKCPELIINSDYTFKGTLNSLAIDNSGTFTKLVAKLVNDNEITFQGKYGQSFDNKDKKLRLFTASNEIEISTKTFKFDMISLNEKDETDANLIKNYFSKNSEEMDKLLRKPVMDTFVKILDEELNKLLKVYPAETLLIDE